MRKRFTLILASLFLVMGTAWADFTTNYTSSTAWTAAGSEDVSTELQAVITSHNCDGAVCYRTNEVIVSAEGDITATFRYTTGGHMIAILGMELLNGDGSVAVADYHYGTAGGQLVNNEYTLSGVAAGEYIARYFVCDKAGDHALNYTNGYIAFVGNITERTLDVEPISTEYLYQIKNVAYSRMLTATDAYAGTTSTNDATDLTQLWAFEATETEGVYKLFNKGRELYLGHSDADNTAWPVNATGSEFTISIQKAATAGDPTPYYVIKHPNGNAYAHAHDANWGWTEQVVKWLPDAAASQWIFIKTDISVEAQSVEFTYSITYDDNEIATEIVSGIVGEEYPEISVVLPFGVKVVKPAGEIAENVNGTTVAIEVEVDLPFVPAASYDEITHWYYMNIRDDGPTYLAYDSSKEYIPARATSVDLDNKDNYTWAFIGDPFNGYQIVNYAAGKAMVLSAPVAPTDSKNAAELARMVQADTIVNGNKTWMFSNPTHDNAAANSFYVQHPTVSAYAFNRQSYDGGNSLCYWTGRDTGSAVQLVERDMSGATDLQALIDVVEEKDYVEGTTVGYIKSLATLNTAIADAKAAVESKIGCFEAAEALQAAVAALETVQPDPTKFYTIVSAMPTTDARGGQMMYINADSCMQFRPEYNDSAVFQFVDAGEGKFYLYNATSKTYLSTAKAHGSNSQAELKAKTVEDAKPVVITNMGRSNVVKIVPEGGAMLHAQADGSKVVGWNSDDNMNASAWVIEETSAPTGIEQLTAPTSTVIYDLTGRRVEKMQKGIYIVNGKKVLVK